MNNALEKQRESRAASDPLLTRREPKLQGGESEETFWQSVEDLEEEKLMRQKKASGGIVHQDSASDSTRELNTLVAKTGTNALSSIPAATWRELEVTVDSGACDTVLPTDQCQEIKLQESEQSKQGLEYEVANGDTIPNLGERRYIMMTENSSNPKRIAFQVADVHKALLSVTRAADMGYQCVLGKNGGWLQDETSSERIPIQRKGNLYVMRVWVKECPFGRPR